MSDCPVLHPITTRVGDPAWRADGYDDVTFLLSDRLLSRAHPDPARASRMSRSALFGGPTGSDPAAEAACTVRRRRQLAPVFSARRMTLLRPRVHALVAGLLDDLLAAGAPADLHAALSFPLPVLVICELLGVPYADRDTFGRWADEAADTVDEDRSRRGLGALGHYMAELVARKQVTPVDDVVSDLVRAAEREGRPVEEVSSLAAALLFAGFETTVAAIDRAVVLLATHRDQWALVCADPALVPDAVEETLRCSYPGSDRAADGLFRYAVTDLIGTPVRRGDMVVLGIDEANRDHTRFPDPDRFDVRRTPNPHLTFGHGRRYCLGAALARTELIEVVTALARRLPGLEPDVPLAELRTVPDRLVSGLAVLPVRW